MRLVRTKENACAFYFYVSPWNQHFDVEEKDADKEDKNNDKNKDEDEDEDHHTNNLECFLATLGGVTIHDDDDDEEFNQVIFKKFSKGYQICGHPLRGYAWDELSAGTCEYFVDGVLPLHVAIEFSNNNDEWGSFHSCPSFPRVNSPIYRAHELERMVH